MDVTDDLSAAAAEEDVDLGATSKGHQVLDVLLQPSRKSKKKR